MFDDEDEYFDREPEPLLIQAAAVAAGMLLVVVCIWLGAR